MSQDVAEHIHRAPGRAGLVALEAAMLGLPADQLGNCEDHTHHYFAPGLYAREYRLPAGHTLIGKIHKFEHLALLACGDMTIADERGARRVQGPVAFVSEAGAKRAGYAHTDAVFFTFHPTDKTDLQAIEDDVIAPSYEALDQFLLERTL